MFSYSQFLFVFVMFAFAAYAYASNNDECRDKAFEVCDKVTPDPARISCFFEYYRTHGCH